MRVRVQPSVDLVDGHDEGLVEEERLDALEERHLGYGGEGRRIKYLNIALEERHLLLEVEA